MDVEMDLADSFQEWHEAASRYLYTVAYAKLYEACRTAAYAEVIVADYLGRELVKKTRDYTEFPSPEMKLEFDIWHELPQNSEKKEITPRFRELLKDKRVVPFKRWAAWYIRNRTLTFCLKYLQEKDVISYHDGSALQAIVPAPDSDSPLLSVLMSELKHEVRECVDRLPSPHNRIWACRHFDKLSYREVAVKVGVTESRVNHSLKDGDCKSRLARCMIAKGYGRTRGDK